MSDPIDDDVVVPGIVPRVDTSVIAFTIIEPATTLAAFRRGRTKTPRLRAEQRTPKAERQKDA